MTTTHLRRFLAPAAAVLLLLTSCSADADSHGESGGVPPESSLPEISGDFGDAPDFTWPAGEAPGELQIEVLHEGEGQSVAEGSSVVANYAGYVWGAQEPFDSSYERGEPTSFPLDGVIAGWRDGIPGHTIGSRLLLSVPPEDGYGPEGNPGAGIGGQDTIVFVVDLVATFTDDSLGEPDATPVDLPAQVPVSVEGNLGERFTVEVDEGAPEPTKPEAFALSRGSGPKVENGQQVVLAYTLTTWDNETTESSWMPELGPEAGPQTLSVGAGSALDLLEGFEVGSRVLMTQVETDDAPPLVIVADVLAAY